MGLYVSLSIGLLWKKSNPPPQGGSSFSVVETLLKSVEGYNDV